ncbi:glycosyltransferase [Bifidobacterium animalis]|uniref:glycosyltransferase n=1 Tax=Bifidobacterium animalis TaxID=28025 RepID=UPI001020C18A|nr:glycosyltransferase [Bifidobacterium animalis]
MNKDIAAGIVLFNPDKERFQNCIDSVLEQVEHLYIFDNSTSPVHVPPNPKITYITENINKGIAFALNSIMKCAEEDGFFWVLTMDQDSILPRGMVQDFQMRIKDDNGKTAIFCPQVIDKRRAYMSAMVSDSVIEVSECITSASCTSIQAWRTVGQFDDWLFIDLVDNDFCKRLSATGYLIKQVNNWVLDQEFGKIIPKSPRSQKFWIRLSQLLRNKNIAKFSYNKYVSPMRVYYTNRNIIYVNRKLEDFGPTAYSNYNCKTYIGFIASFNIPSLLRAQQKRKVLSAILRGICDGLHSHPAKWKAPSLRYIIR